MYNIMLSFFNINFPKHTWLCGFKSAIFIILGAQVADAEVKDVCRLFGESDMISQNIYMHQEDITQNILVPKVYFEDMIDFTDNSTHNAQLFTVMMDDFQPVYRSQTASLIRDNNLSFMTFVLHDFPPLDQLLYIVASLTYANQGRDSSNYIELEDRFGLLSVVPKYPQPTSTDRPDREELFIARDEDLNIISVITCRNKVDSIKFPSCDQDISVHGFDIRVNYRKEYLWRWPSILSDISDFLECAKENE